jgi:hypothetical protein
VQGCALAIRLRRLGGFFSGLGANSLQIGWLLGAATRQTMSPAVIGRINDAPARLLSPKKLPSAVVSWRPLLTSPADAWT